MYSLLELEAGRNSHLTSGTKGTVKTKTLLEISFGTRFSNMDGKNKKLIGDLIQ